MKTYSKPAWVALCLVAVLVTGYVDYATGYEANFAFFYMLPIIAAAISIKPRAGYGIALLCTAVWGFADYCAGHTYRHSASLVWNIGIRFLTFETVAYLAGRVPHLTRASKPDASKPDASEGEPGSAPTVGGLHPYQNRLSIQNKIGRLLWTIVWIVLFRPSPPPFHLWRVLLLRIFGARIGRRCIIMPSCRIWAPWNLEMGSDCQLGAGVDCYSVAPITIGDRTIISQGAYLCAASHDIMDPAFALIQAPIRIGADVWIAARSFVRPGISVGRGGVVGACAVVTKNVEPWTVVAGSPARIVKRRNTDDEGIRRPDGGRRLKVGIITFHRSENYGAALQAYALQTVIEQLGCDVEIIDYRPAYLITGGSWLLPVTAKRLFANAGILLIKMERVRSFFTGRTRHRLFLGFLERHLHLTTASYKSLRDLRARLPAYDALVCGSDQIWNPPPRFGVDPAFYLDFGPPACRRVAFAPSFGGAGVDAEYREQIGRLLGGLDAISVREQSGISIVEQLAGRHPAWVPDPTMLLKDYTPLQVKPPLEHFIFTYCLRTTSTVGRVQAVVARRLGLPVLTPSTSGARWSSGGHAVQIGPQEWLGYMAQARVVLTNSFHGTVFSILFRKTFVTVAISGRNSKLNERLTSLLERLGLLDRFITDEMDDDEVIRRLNAPIDWDGVNARLQVWRDEAWAYLQEALAGSAPAPRPAEGGGGR